MPSPFPFHSRVCGLSFIIIICIIPRGWVEGGWRLYGGFLERKCMHPCSSEQRIAVKGCSGCTTRHGSERNDASSVRAVLTVRVADDPTNPCGRLEDAKTDENRSSVIAGWKAADARVSCSTHAHLGHAHLSHGQERPPRSPEWPRSWGPGVLDGSLPLFGVCMFSPVTARVVVVFFASPPSGCSGCFLLRPKSLRA